MNGSTVGVLVAIAIFVTVRVGWQRWVERPLNGAAASGNPSPRWGVIAWEWIRAHTRRDPEPEPEPEPPILTQDFEWGSVDYTESAEHRQTVRTRPPRPKPVAPPAKRKAAPARPGPRPNDRLDVWVAESLDNGARYSDVVAQGRRIFGVSDATVKRSIKKARRNPQ